jgi:hypothetical protein
MVPVIEALETHSDVSARPWAAAQVRPEQYPEEIPFLAGHAAAVLAVGGSTTVEWDGVEIVVAERMARGLVLEGWNETTLPERSIPGMVIRILHNAGRLTLLDTRAE